MNSESSTPNSRPDRTPPRFGRLLVILGLLVLAGLVLGLSPRWSRRRALIEENRELAIPTVVVVSPVPATNSGAPLLPAEVLPWVEAPIFARASGYLKRWNVDLGDRVEAGQVLAEIDTPEVDQELARARAELAQAEAARTLAGTSAERWAELLKTASVSEQEAAEKRADLALKTALVQAAEANVHRLEELRGFSRVTAPFAGTITRRQTDVGQLVSAGAPKELFRLAQLNPLRVHVRVPQAQARDIHVGDTATLLIPELPRRTFPATVVRTAGAVDPESRTLLVELRVDNESGELLAGSFGQVRWAGAAASPVPTLPSNVLLFRSEGVLVGVVKAGASTNGARVELRRVKLGRDFGKAAEILEGIREGEQVILNPADSLVDGAEVRVAVSAAATATSAGGAAAGAAPTK